MFRDANAEVSGSIPSCRILEPTATEYESSPASPEDLRGDEAVSSNEMNSEKVGMERDRKQTNRLGRNDDAADDFEGSAEFISAKESEAGSM